MATATARVRAPELKGSGGWINTATPLQLMDLRGRAVVLDFWTFCCINCLRVVEELRPLEERFGDRLVVVGVHSPKFPHEADHAAVERAVRRHRITHPVLDDPQMETWQRYGVRAWPTLVVIDPDGYLAAVVAGEGHGAAVGELIDRLLSGRDVPAGNAFTRPPPKPDGELMFPGKVSSDGQTRIALADTGHDRVLVCTLTGEVLAEHGDFHQPQGVRFDGDRLLVCDTVAGALVAVSLSDGSRTTLADGMHSPWDCLLLPGSQIAVAEAGLHHILTVPANGGQFSVLAGTRAEGLRDGPALQAHLAQPSGLTLLSGGALAFADSEVSALRLLRDGQVLTLVGQGLFDWGDGDGDREHARLQHPLGVAALPDGALAVADTFNSRLRLWRAGTLSTIQLDSPLSEPGGVDLLPDGRLVVADTNNNRVVVVDIASGHVQPLDIARDHAPALSGTGGALLRVDASVDLAGETLDASQGPPLRVSVTAEPGTLLGAGPRAWAFDHVPAQLELTLGRPGEGTLTIDVIAATCHGDVCTIRRSTRNHSLRVS